MSDAAAHDFYVPLKAGAEDLDVEFKRTLPLKANEGKAKLAKEICALTNHGGGWIVLGREDDGSYPSTPAEELAGVSQDTINQIASAYLQPAPHCSVKWLEPDEVGYEVLVVWVSAVGVAPVCGLKNGPNDNKGKTVGISKGVHYIRKAGPVSAPIETPDEWQSVIRRCVLNDKAALLGALTTMIEQPVATEEKEKNVLDADIEHILGRWREDAARTPYEVDLAQNYVCYGFQFLEAEPTTIGQLKECLRKRSSGTHGNHTFFDDGYSTTASPVVIENAEIDGLDVSATSEDFDLRFIWRLSEALSGCEIVSYWEDTAWIKGAVEDKSSLTWERGTKIWIGQQISFANSFLAIVDHLANCLGYGGKVRISVFFSGLKERSLGSPSFGVYYSMNYEAHQNTKKIDFTIERSALSPEARSATIVSIIQPMNKLTQGPEVSTARVIKSLESMG